MLVRTRTLTATQTGPIALEPVVPIRGTFHVTAGAVSNSYRRITATAPNVSGVLVTGGSLRMSRPTVTNTGSSTSPSQARRFGLGAAVLATAGSIRVTAGTVTSTGDGAAGAYARGNATITVSRATVTTTGHRSNALMAVGGGTVVLTDTRAATHGIGSAVIATKHGDVRAVRGRFTSTGRESPILDSEGVISGTGIVGNAAQSEAVVIGGSGQVSLSNCDLVAGAGCGIAIRTPQAVGADDRSRAMLTIRGGSLTAAAGPVLSVTGARATVTFVAASVSADSGILVRAAAGSPGAPASGGAVVLRAHAQALSGAVLADGSSSVAVHLSDGSTWSGSIDPTHLTNATAVHLDETSLWSVTANSFVGTLTGVRSRGRTVENIRGNGCTVRYDGRANPALGGRRYALAGGGTLLPA